MGEVVNIGPMVLITLLRAVQFYKREKYGNVKGKNKG